MLMGKNIGGGTPLYDEGRLVGWVCTTLNKQWSYLVAGRPDVHSVHFPTKEDAAFALISEINKKSSQRCHLNF